MASTHREAQDIPNAAASEPAYEPARQSQDTRREGTLTTSPGEPEKVRNPSPEREEKPKSDDGALIIGWDGPDDPANPRKCVLSVFQTRNDMQEAELDTHSWTKKKKWAASFVISGFTFISPISSSMVAPAAAQIAEQFHITSSAEASLTISVFVLAYGTPPRRCLNHIAHLGLSVPPSCRAPRSWSHE